MKLKDETFGIANSILHYSRVHSLDNSGLNDSSNLHKF